MLNSNPEREVGAGLRTYFLVCLLGISVGLNIFFGLRIYTPKLWHDLQLAMVRPPVLRSDDHLRGPADGPVTIIEYSDFECPFSAQIHPSLKRLTEENRIRWVYRSFPLSAMHPHAAEAAEAAECAGDQAKFWEYADVLFESQGALRNSGSAASFLTGLADRVGLNEEGFQSCLSAHRSQGRIRSLVAEGKSERIEATPTLFVNGKRQVGSLSFEKLEQLVRGAAKQAGK